MGKESADEVTVEAAVKYLDGLVYPSGSYFSYPGRMRQASGLALDELYMLIHLAQARNAGSGLGSGVLRGLCHGTLPMATAELAKRVHTLYHLDSLRGESGLGVGAFYSTLLGITDDGVFPDWEDEDQRARARPMLEFALASLRVGRTRGGGIKQRIDGSLEYEDAELRQFVARHSEETARIIELYWAQGLRLAQVIEMVEGATALAEGAL